jgi:hypothetical protein
MISSGIEPLALVTGGIRYPDPQFAVPQVMRLGETVHQPAAKKT